MSYSALAVFLMEIMGTLAFASSGALTGIRKGMDLFGVNVLGIVTAVGGGVIRDVTLGINPPSTFQAPVYTLCAAAISTLLFVIVYHNQAILQRRFFCLYERVMTCLLYTSILTEEVRPAPQISSAHGGRTDNSIEFPKTLHL